MMKIKMQFVKRACLVKTNADKYISHANFACRLKQNYNRMKCVVSFLVMSVSVLSSFGQQDPMFSQYMFNVQAYNPAYAGTWESIGFMTLGRYQWIGFEGGPQTQTFTIQAPLRNENVGLGLSVINDEIGEEKRFAVFSDYSYRLKLDQQVFMRLGLKAGFSSYQNIFSNYITYTSVGESDPAFEKDIDRKIMPNFGLGVFLYSPVYYLGVSVPKLLQNDFDQGIDGYATNLEMRHFTLIGGWVFELSESLKFKPSFITRYVKGSPVVGDVNANFLLKDKYWLGAMVRTSGEYGFNMQFIINKKLRLGYAIDFDTSKIRSYNDGTHEIMISYELSSVTTRYASPRYF